MRRRDFGFKANVTLSTEKLRCFPGLLSLAGCAAPAGHQMKVTHTTFGLLNLINANKTSRGYLRRDFPTSGKNNRTVDNFLPDGTDVAWEKARQHRGYYLNLFWRTLSKAIKFCLNWLATAARKQQCCTSKRWKLIVWICSVIRFLNFREGGLWAGLYIRTVGNSPKLCWWITYTSDERSQKPLL